MKRSSKIIALVLAVVMVFLLIPITTVSAAQPEKLYLTPNANWKKDNARFAAYFFGNGETWVSMTYNSELGLYEVTVPTAKTYPNVIFCRMNPNASANNWNNKWNQTSDLTIPTNGNNHYTVKEGTWDKGGGTWSQYIIDTGECAHANVTTEQAAATCTTDGYKRVFCNDCEEYTVNESYPATGHTYSSATATACSVCSAAPTWTVAGSGAHLGTEWDTGNTANDMTYADGVYTKVYTNVAAGSYALKVVRDHDWGTAYPSADKAYTVATSGSTVTVTLKGTTVTVTVEVPHTCSWSDATCTEPQKCSCGETQGEALGHDMVAGEVVAPTLDAQGYTVYGCSRCDVTENRDFVDALVAVATADGDPYATLAEALANGSEIVLLANIELDSALVITGSHTIDLNGFTLSYTSEVMGEAMITNKGNLTINDSVGTGVINYNYVGANDASYGKGNYTISNAGTLTVNGGKITIANLRQHAKYPIDNNSTTGDAILVINGGHLYNYNTSAIRMFCNSTTYKNSVTINGGIVEGYSAIWMQNPGKNTVNGDLTITGGEIRTTAAAYVAGTAALKDVSSNLYTTIDGEGGAWSEDSFISITGGTLNENVNVYYEAPANVTVGGEAVFNGNCFYYVAHEHSWSDATCTEPQKCECGETQGEALGHTWENCACATCGTVLPTLGQNESFSFTTQADFDAVVASGKLTFVGSFRDNGGSFQFNTNSTIQFVVPANTTVTIAGHSAQYGVFNVYLNGEKTAMEGTLSFTVTEETKVVIATGDNGASYSYIKSITLEEHVDRTISSDTTITFGSEGNYKNSVVDFSGIQIGDNGGNNSQVKNGSFNLELKAGAVVTIHGYPGYTSYKLNDGEAIESEYYTYVALTDTVLTVTPVSGNNYFYSIEVKFHEGITLVEAKESTCNEAGHEAYYACTCHGELTTKVEREILAHTPGAEATCTTAQTCTVCGTELAAKLGHVDANLDVDCDREGCTGKVAPPADTVLSAFTANNLGSKLSTSGSYYVIGTIVEVLDQKNGVFLIDDGTGETFYFRLPKNAEGVAHASWEIKLTLGDKVQVYGKINKYSTNTAPNGQYWPAIQSGVVTVLEQHAHFVNGEIVCTKDTLCACGTVVAPATGHIDADASGLCDACNWDMNLVEVNIAIGTDPKYNGVVTNGDDGKALYWTWSAEGFDAIIHKGTSTVTVYTTAKDYMQLKKQNTLTIVNKEDVTVKYVVISVTNATYLGYLKTALSTQYEYTVDEVNFTATIQLNSTEDFVMENKASSTIYVNGVTIVYAKKGAHVHEFKETITTPATCTEAGLKTFTCDCGEGTYTEVIEALGHNFVEGVCSRCEEKDPNYVPPCAHKDAGLDAKCDVCGEYFLPTSPFKLEMYQATKNETYYFTGSMSGYYFATSTDITKAVDLYAEKVDGGYNVYFMSGSTKNYLYIELSGTHINAKFGTTQAVWYVDETYGALVTEVDGAKYFLGTYSSYVTFGGTAYSRLTDATADVSQYVGRAVSLEEHECTNTTATVTAPTCTEQGYTTYNCADCGLSTKADYVDALGHTAGAEATCTEAQICTVCGTELAAALGHSHEAVVTAPTCTEAGYTTYTCACGDTYTGDETEALGHTYEDGKCSCGAEDPEYVAPHEHEFVEGKCECGEIDPDYVEPHEHEFVEGKCECGEIDPDYVEPQPPVDDGNDGNEEPTNFFQMLINLLMQLIEMLKKLFNF